MWNNTANSNILNDLFWRPLVAGERPEVYIRNAVTVLVQYAAHFYDNLLVEYPHNR